MLKILGWIILIFLAIIGFLALCVYFFPDLKASQPKKDYLDKHTKNAYQTLASLPGHIHLLIPQMPINTKANFSWVGIASFYSIESLKKEGTWKISKGRMANNELFDENRFTCASWDFPFKTKLRITTIKVPEKSIIVEVTDRTNKRFKGKRIDLTPVAMEVLGGKQALIQGLLKVKVELLNRREAGGNK